MIFARSIRARDGRAPAGTPILTVYRDGPCRAAWRGLAGGLGLGQQRSGRLGESQACGAHAQDPGRAALEKNYSKLPF